MYQKGCKMYVKLVRYEPKDMNFDQYWTDSLDYKIKQLLSHEKHSGVKDK